MLETFMFATESFGTWGPGPVPEPVGYWARILDSVVNDPQAVATILAAFVGFAVGVLGKYWLDRRADRLRGEADRQNLESALRAELVSLDLACDTRIKQYKKVLKERPEKEVLGGPHIFVRMVLPPRRVWMAQLGRIGDLKGVNTETLVLVHGMFDSYDIDVQTQRQRAGDQGVQRDVLQTIVDALEKMREAIVKVGGPLYEQTKIDRSWWLRVLDI